MSENVKIDELPETSLESLGHAVPAIKDGQTVQLSIAQIVSLAKAEILNDPEILGSKFPVASYIFAGRPTIGGWIALDADGITIGNATSGADYAGADYAALFEFAKAWSVNSGSEVFANDDTVSLGTVVGHVIAARGLSPGALTVAGSGINGTELGAGGGAETVGLTLGQIPSHRHWFSRFKRQRFATGTVDDYLPYSASTSDTSGSWHSRVSLYTNYEGGNQLHQNTQPTTIANLFIKY